MLGSMAQVYIVGAARTPVAKSNTLLQHLQATELGASAIRGALEQSGIPVGWLSHVYMGHVLQAGTGQSPAKQAAIGGGLPNTVEATTINKVCASGLKAISLAAQEIILGHATAQVAGGMESMSNVPKYLHKKDGNTLSDDTGDTSDTHQAVEGLQDGLMNPYDDLHMGDCADRLAARYHVSREDQDEYAACSYDRARAAHTKQVFRTEIVPVSLALVKALQQTSIDADALRNPAMFGRLSTLTPAFITTGTVTSGNSSSLADGAAAVVLANAACATQYCRESRIIARIVSFADASVAPRDFALAPSKSIEMALSRAQLTVDQVSLWEINEAFALVVLLTQEIVGMDPAKVNVTGGAIAFGHPLGSSGCRILVTLLHQLKPGQYGVAAVCNGGGGSTAMVVQRLDAEHLVETGRGLHTG